MNLTRPLDDLMPGLRGHVLTVLLRSPRPLTGRAVARRAGTVSHSSVKLVLDSLAAAGIVRPSLVSGSGHFYELNQGHVLAEPLRQMDRALDEFLAMAQRLIRSWPTAPLSVVLFGSVARGTSTADSDTPPTPTPTPTTGQSTRSHASVTRRGPDLMRCESVVAVESISGLSNAPYVEEAGQL